jgi:hypothetical protein
VIKLVNYNKEGQIKDWEAFQKGVWGSFGIKHFAMFMKI